MGIKVAGYSLEKPGYTAHVSLLRYELKLRITAPGIHVSLADIYHSFYSIFQDPQWGSDLTEIEFPLEIDHERNTIEVKSPWIFSLHSFKK